MRQRFIAIAAVVVSVSGALVAASAVPAVAKPPAEASPCAGKIYVTAPTNDASKSAVFSVDAESGELSAPISTGSLPIPLGMAPDGKTLYVINANDSTLVAVDTATLTVGAPVAMGTSVTDLAVTPDGKAVYVTKSVDGTVVAVDTKTDAVSDPVKVGVNPTEVVVAPNGKKAYVLNGDNTVSVITTKTGAVAATIPIPAFTPILGLQVGRMVVSPDSNRLYVIPDTVIDTAKNKVVGSISPNSFVGSSLVVTPDGKHLYSPTKSATNTPGTASTVTNFDTKTGAVSATISTRPGGGGAAVSADGTKLYVGHFFGSNSPTDSFGRGLQVIDTRTNKVTANFDGFEIDGQEAGPYDVAVCPAPKKKA